MLKIRYTKHGLERMNERGVTKQDIKEALGKGNKTDGEYGARVATHKTRKGMLTCYL